MQPGEVIGRLPGLIMKVCFLLIKNILKLLAKSVLTPLVLTLAGTRSHKNIIGSGMITLIISNEEIDDIMKIVKFLKESGLLIKSLKEQLKLKQKNKKVDFL